MALLANLSAYDFGYLSMGQLLARTQDTLRSMARLERYQGHFYNWYDTQTLAPLEPRYVSTVDSGNLTGYLIVLQQGLLELAHAPLLHPDCLKGLADTLAVIGEHIKSPPAVMLEFRQLLENPPPENTSLNHTVEYLQSLSLAAEKIVAHWTAEDTESPHERISACIRRSVCFRR
jgi:hypothetical protein